jgi:hypothetical protein
VRKSDFGQSGPHPDSPESENAEGGQPVLKENHLLTRKSMTTLQISTRGKSGAGAPRALFLFSCTFQTNCNPQK